MKTPVCEQIGSPWEWETGCHSMLRLGLDICDDDVAGRTPRCALVDVSYGQPREWQCVENGYARLTRTVIDLFQHLEEP